MSMKILLVKGRGEERGGGVNLLLNSGMEIMFTCKHKLPPTLKE